ncbi:LTA synthase family protein [Pseudocolwellia sp. HL-MZ7]|uniref:LTA synthase family protein n=1 Tax=Pseudocolwellia sp. HL-MZ7 TaxID=3400627 RepID=UPI003CEA81D7
MWSGRLSLFILIFIVSISTWLLEELLIQQRTEFSRLDSLTFTLFTISLLYLSFNIFNQWSTLFLLGIITSLSFTIISIQFYQYFGGYIGYEQLFMFNDLLGAIKYVDHTTLITLLMLSICLLLIGRKIFIKNINITQQLSLRQKWRAPLIYFAAAVFTFQAHNQYYVIEQITNIHSSEDITYNFNIETPTMYFIRSLPIFVRFMNKESYNKIAKLKVLVSSLKNQTNVKLPKEYHFDNFNKLLTPYTGYHHQKNILEPLLFSPKEIRQSKKEKRNIILIVLESFRAYETGLFNNKYSLTPNLDEISLKAIIASNFYSNSRTTVQAEQAILCSSLDFASKSPYSVKKGGFNGRCLPKLLSEEGYETYWYHGYTKEFFNRQVFHPSLGFQHLISKESFLDNGYDDKLDIGWGVPDPIVFQKLFDDMVAHNKNSNTPFFSQILTLTNHQPFNWKYSHINFPNNINKKSDVVYDNYQKGIYYTDNALGEFWRKFENSPLAKNTTVIITADHGVPFYPEGLVNEAKKHEILYRVPLLIVTPERNNKIITTPLSHLDIAPTILSFLQIHKPVAFIGRPFLGDNATSVPRPLFQMNTAYIGFQYNKMQCLPYKSICNEKKK